MFVIDGICLDDVHSWILDTPKKKQKKIGGVILLTSTQNSEGHIRVWQKMVETLDPLPEKVIFCENDSNDNTLNLIKNWSFPREVISFKSRKKDRDSLYKVIAKNRQYLLERARVLKPKFVIYFDDDVFPEDRNFVERLTSHKLDIVGGAYLRPFGSDGYFVAANWSLNSRLTEFPASVNLKETLRKARRENLPYLKFSSCDRRLYKVATVSAGCLCLSSSLIQDRRVNFYPLREDSNGGEEVPEDFGYCLSAWQCGYEVYLDGDVRLSHLAPSPKRRRPWAI